MCTRGPLREKRLGGRKLAMSEFGAMLPGSMLPAMSSAGKTREGFPDGFTDICTPCSNGKSAPGSDAIADCTCDPGFYRSGDFGERPPRLTLPVLQLNRNPSELKNPHNACVLAGSKIA